MATVAQRVDFAEVSAPATPSSATVRLYAKSDGHLYQKDDGGTETDLTSGAAVAFVGAKAYRTSTQSVNNTTAALSFDSEEYDSDGFHEGVTNPTRFTVPSGKSGKYRLTAGSGILSTTNGSRMFFRLNGATALRGQAGIGGLTTGNILTIDVDLAVSDYVEIMLHTVGTTAAGHATNAEQQCWMSVFRLG